MTLTAYVKKRGGLDRAAKAIGVSRMTLWRWLHRGVKPHGLVLARLRALRLST